jgi:hypothetical protein
MEPDGLDQGLKGFLCHVHNYYFPFALLGPSSSDTSSRVRKKLRKKHTKSLAKSRDYSNKIHQIQMILNTKIMKILFSCLSKTYSTGPPCRILNEGGDRKDEY